MPNPAPTEHLHDAAAKPQNTCSTAACAGACARPTSCSADVQEPPASGAPRVPHFATLLEAPLPRAVELPDASAVLRAVYASQFLSALHSAGDDVHDGRVRASAQPAQV